MPMIVRWPGRIRAGIVSNRVWAFWDFLPTAAALAGTNAPKKIDGVSLLPFLLGRSQKDHDYLYWEFFERGFQQAIRVKNWKGVRLAAGGPLELYDLGADIGEQNDVAALHPDVVAHMEKLLKTARTDSEGWPVQAAEAPKSR